MPDYYHPRDFCGSTNESSFMALYTFLFLNFCYFTYEKRSCGPLEMKKLFVFQLNTYPFGTLCLHFLLAPLVAVYLVGGHLGTDRKVMNYY